MFGLSKLYSIGIVAVLALSLYGYIYYLKSELEISQLNEMQLKANEKQIIKAYENSINVIEKVKYQEGLNKQSANTAKDISKKVEKLIEKRGKLNETDINDSYDITSF